MEALRSGVKNYDDQKKVSDWVGTVYDKAAVQSKGQDCCPDIVPVGAGAGDCLASFLRKCVVEHASAATHQLHYLSTQHDYNQNKSTHIHLQTVC